MDALNHPSKQNLQGNDNIQVGDKSSVAISNTHYHPAPSQPVDADTLTAALDKLSALPLDEIPAPTSLPPKSRMPLRRNPHFVGRENDLRTLAKALKNGGAAAIGHSPAITGMGGLGKSQLASEFAYRYGQYFAGGVFWLSFADPSVIPSEIAICGGAQYLALQDGFDRFSLQEQVGKVAAAWHSGLPRLLIFDNCEDEDLLYSWLPRNGECRVLLTSRKSEWDSVFALTELGLDILSPEHSLALLRNYRPDLQGQDAQLAAIAEELGHLPLALQLAGHYLKRYRRSELGNPEHYLRALQDQGVLDHPSLKEGGHSPTEHEQHVGKTFLLSYQQLKTEDAIDQYALGFLTCAACFAPGEPIPRDLLTACLNLPDGEDHAAEDALRRLSELGLLEQEANGAVKLHRLLAAFVCNTAETIPNARSAVENVVEDEAKRLIHAGYPAAFQHLQVHLNAVTQTAIATESDNAIGLCLSRGRYLMMIADFAEAKVANTTALDLVLKAANPNHPLLATCHNNLGSVLESLSDFESAQAAYERALKIDEAAYGPNHPEVAILLNNLGGVFNSLGDFEKAKAAFERALKIDEAAYGPNHPGVATDVNNLGGVLESLGDLEGAKAAYERALEIDEAAYGPDHPRIAIRLNNLGSVFKALDKLNEAKAAFERALSIDEATYGPNHPSVATRLNNLGSVLVSLGDIQGAKAAYERTLKIDEAAYGPNHPTVARDVNNLGSVLYLLGDIQGAKDAVRRALLIDEEVYGPDHPTTVLRRENLNFLNRLPPGA